LLAGCGGSSDSSDEIAPIIPPVVSPSFSLAVSDAPVDALSQVVVCFNQIELKRGGGNVVFTVGDESEMIAANDLCLNANDEVIANTVGIDLKTYTGSDSIALVDGITIEADSYTQMRLIISEGSYGIDAESGDKISVSVPSNELKLDGFTANVGGVIDFTLEFDLNKAMTNPVGQTGYFLKPRGVRLVDNSEAGHIEGSVAEGLLIDNQCTPLSDASENIASVYLYGSPDLAIETLADNDGSEEHQPLASTSVIFDSEQISYNFEIGFINAGDYTIAVSCDTEDEPEVDDVVTFISAQNVNIVAGSTTQVGF
jgi:hypothetical protein